MKLGDLAIFIGSFIILLIWLGQSLWIYLDARNRDERFALGWAILSLFSVPVSLIVYLMITRGTRINHMHELWHRYRKDLQKLRKYYERKLELLS